MPRLLRVRIAELSRAMLARRLRSNDAETVLALLPIWIDDYNDTHPHSGDGFRSPREYRAMAECA